MTELLYKQLSFDVVGAAMEVYNVLGSGFLEAVYQAAIEKELKLRGILFERKVKLPVSYKGELIGEIKPQGNIPQLQAGNNQVQFSCDVSPGVSTRANVTIISQDENFIGE